MERVKKNGVPSRNPLIPMVSISGTPTRADIVKMMEAYSNVGISQLLIYPRYGCEIEYMSERWFELCQDILETAEKLDFTIWLYDEFNWPSGRCNGTVPAADPAYVCKALDVTLDGGKLKVETVMPVGDQADILDQDAMDLFISLTHEKYWERFSRYFGNVIRGIFTDEPSQRYSCNITNIPGHFRLPYYEGLEADYEKETGHGLEDDFAGYFALGTGNPWPVYFGLLGGRMRKVYFDSLRNWCDSHGILLTGHLLGEGAVHDAIFSNGDPLLAIKGFNLPGMDEITTKVKPGNIEWATLAIVGHGISCRGNGGMAELFALGPADLTLSKIHQMIWLTAFYGVDLYLLAVAHIFAHGNVGRPDFFNATSPMQPWFEAYRELGADAGEAALFATKEAVPGILVRYPQAVGSEHAWKRGRGGDKADLRKLLEMLVSIQLQWELIPEEDQRGNAQAVINILPEGALKDEVTGQDFEDTDILREWLGRSIRRQVSVVDGSGTLADNVLVKYYTDGMVAVLDLNDELNGKARKLFLKQDGIEDVPFILQCRGVFTTGQCEAISFMKTGIPVQTAEFELRTDRRNLMRCLLMPENGKDTFEFEAGCDLNGVKALLRSYGGQASATLDGRQIDAAYECEDLPDGFNKLYKSSGAFTLAKGKHKIVLASGTKEYPYLANIYLSGDFGVYQSDYNNGDNTDNGSNTELSNTVISNTNINNTIKGNDDISNNKNSISFSRKYIIDALPKAVGAVTLKNSGLLDYAGKITLTADVNVPVPGCKGEIYLKLNTNELFTEVRINGESVGTCTWAPFVWKIPVRFHGRRVRIEIIEATSLGAIFGDYPQMLYDTKSPYWKVSPLLPGKNTDCGILETPEWIFAQE